MGLSGRWRFGLAALLAATLLAGCKKTDGDNGGKGDGGGGNPLLGQPQPGRSGVLRAVDRPKVQNDLKQIALLYRLYVTDPGKHTEQGFKDYIQRDAQKLVQALDQRIYVLVMPRDLSSANIVAYEKAADGYGRHYAVMGDGSVADPMSTQQLDEQLKKQGVALEK
jgi:hypothetical protein